MEENHVYDLIIIGAGSAGLSAGTYAARAGLEVLLLEKAYPGGQIAIAGEIENYPAMDGIPGAELAEKLLAQAKKFGAVLKNNALLSFDFYRSPKSLVTGDGELLSRTVIIASGAKPKKAGFEGESEFFGRGVSYCAQCDGFFFRDKDVFVIGGGNSAAEEALVLAKTARRVRLLVRKDRMRCENILGERIAAEPNIEICFNSELVGISGGERPRRARIKNTLTGEVSVFETNADEYFGVFVFAGYEPETELFKGAVRLNGQGYITTNELMRTNIPGVFAAGDVREKPLRQIVSAAADGALAALEAQRYINELN